jgi:hypothetical protein
VDPESVKAVPGTAETTVRKASHTVIDSNEFLVENDGPGGCTEPEIRTPLDWAAAAAARTRRRAAGMTATDPTIFLLCRTRVPNQKVA